jgi:hypothetical protein
MDTLYTKRTVSFFVESIQFLKRNSGGQRWNEICEDTSALFFHLCKKQHISISYTSFQIWELFFEPLQSHEILEELCKSLDLQTVLFICLHALLDPPAFWWQTQFR